MRIATIDIGTNTVLLLIGECTTPPIINILADVHAIARLGEGVDESRTISKQALTRFENILASHLGTLKAANVEYIVPFGTSAMRDAFNRQEIIHYIKEKYNIAIELLSGSEESEWTFRGALLGLSNIEQSIGTIDIGGGSTEISVGTATQFETGKSLDIGAVRITERYFRKGELTQSNIESAQKIIQDHLHSLPAKLKAISSLVAVAGTPTSLAAMDQHLPAFTQEKVHGYKLSLSSIEDLFHEMIEVDPDTLCARHPSINRARADILPAGTLILLEALKFLNLTAVTVSTKGLRYGILLREFEKEFGPRSNWSITK